MRIENLTYSKPEGTQDEFALASATPDVPAPAKSETPAVTLGHEGYRKEQPTVEVYRFFIISGGEKREVDYFRFLTKMEWNFRLDRVSLHIISKKGQGLMPDKMVALGNQFRANKLFETPDYAYQLTEDDVIYMISDVDEFYDTLKDAVKREPRFRWIISNPCFEIWLFYHKTDDVKLLGGCDALSPDKRSQWMKQKLNSLGQVQSGKAFTQMRSAIENSKRHCSVDANGIPKLFSTQMHVLANLLLNSLGDDFDQMLEENRQRIAAYKARLNTE